MKKFSKFLVIMLLLVLGLDSITLAATTPSFGMASTYGVLSSTYTNTSATTINGDVGFTIPPAVAPLGVHPNYGVAAPYPQAGIDQGIALTALSNPAQPCTFTFAAGAINLSTDVTHGTIGVYAPGVYCSLGAMTVGGSLNLSGAGTYIFRSFPAALNTAVGSVISLTNGASACDVFWIATNTTLAATTSFVGTVIDNSFITVGASTTWLGRALSFGGTVTTDTDTITAPNCAPGTLRIVKNVVNNNGGVAISNAFNLHVRLAGVDVIGSPALGAGAPGTAYSLSPNTYIVSEDANASYTQSFGGDCNAAGSVTILPGDNKTCTVTNDDIAPPSGGGGGGGVTLHIDKCPNGDDSPSYYDGKCVISPIIDSGSVVVPLIGVINVPTPLSLPEGSGLVVYNYTVWNVGGKIALNNVTLKDDKCNSIILLSGDLNNNNKLDINEKWRYSCTTKLLSTTTNTAIAKGYSDDSYNQVAVATAIATVVVGAPVTPPLINIVKIPNRLTPFPFGGGYVEYTYEVSNPGIVSISEVIVTDNKCSPVSLISGDNNHDHFLDTDETWVYTCGMNISVSTRNIATVKGISNGFVAVDYAFADVLVFVPGFPKTGIIEENNNFKNIMILFGIILASTSIIVILRKRII